MFFLFLRLERPTGWICARYKSLLLLLLLLLLAARVVTLSTKSCHITPILKELHWLPVSQRIVFKLMIKLFTNILITLLQYIFLNCF